MTLETLTSEQSPYLRLIDELDAWYNALPESLLLSSRRIYALQEMKTLSATMHLHLAYHGAITGLTRISLPGFNFALALTMRRAPAAFITQSQRRCLYHCNQISRIIETNLPHGVESFDDQFCGVAAFEASKVQIIYAAVVQQGEPEAMAAAEHCVRANMALMEMTSSDSRLLPVSSAAVSLRQMSNFDAPFQIRIIIGLLQRYHFTELAQCLAERLGSRSPEERSTANSDTAAEDGFLAAIPPFRIAREEVEASDLSSPASTRSAAANILDQSPIAAPPPISTISHLAPRHDDMDMVTPATGWGESGVSDDQSLMAANLEVFGLADLPLMDFMNDGTNYFMWEQTAELANWPDAGLNDDLEGTQ